MNSVAPISTQAVSGPTYQSQISVRSPDLEQGLPARAGFSSNDALAEGSSRHAAVPVDDRELVRHQRTYEHWIKGAIGAGITGLGLYMFKLSVVPGGESVFAKLRSPEAEHDALRHDLIDASLATAGGLLAMYDAYRVYRKEVAPRQPE